MPTYVISNVLFKLIVITHITERVITLPIIK